MNHKSPQVIGSFYFVKTANKIKNKPLRIGINPTLFQVAALSFLNKFSETSVDVREKIMIQTELEEAGFDSATVNKVSEM